jgi:hypothetical protein
MLDFVQLECANTMTSAVLQYTRRKVAMDPDEPSHKGQGVLR